MIEHGFIEIEGFDAQKFLPLSFWTTGHSSNIFLTWAEIIQFLSTNPSPLEVCNYHVSERAQTRLQHLLALNSAGLLGESEQGELDEMEKIEHIMIMYKAQIARQLQQGAS